LQNAGTDHVTWTMVNLQCHMLQVGLTIHITSLCSFSFIREYWFIVVNMILRVLHYDSLNGLHICQIGVQKCKLADIILDTYLLPWTGLFVIPVQFANCAFHHPYTFCAYLVVLALFYLQPLCVYVSMQSSV
jgi:hypothetical protein